MAMPPSPSRAHETSDGPAEIESTTRDDTSWDSGDEMQPALTDTHYHPHGEQRMREQQDQEPPGLTRSQALNLYLSHALSTWNARGYEFAAILFTAAAYPGTLVAASARMIIIYFAMILFSSSIGSWVDNSPSRLHTLLTTIIVNRGSVIIGSLFWLAILSQRDLLLNEQQPVNNSNDSNNGGPDLFLPLPTNTPLKNTIFALAMLCGIIERLSASGNLLSMERDWVPTVAARPDPNSPHKNPYDLTNLNAVMRRIDLVCKLFSPIVLSLVISMSGSTRVGVLFTGTTSAICIPVEILSARGVWMGCRVLQEEKKNTGSAAAPPPPAVEMGQSPPPPPTILDRVIARLRSYPRDFAMYFSSQQSVWIPSLALALLHFNMLTWRATFITYLITVGYSLNVITAARTAGSLFEITSTVITPRAVVYLGRHVRGSVAGGGGGIDDEDGEAGQGLLDEHGDGDAEARVVDRDEFSGDVDEGDAERQTLTGLQRTGLWGITWQVAMTVPVVLAIWSIQVGTSDDVSNDTGSSTDTVLTISNSILLFTFLAMSRLGVWIFDLTTQQLTQTLVPSHQRSSFAGVENSITNIFELAGAMSSIAFPQPRQYPWLATASLSACLVSWALYCGWVRRRRGHLVHLDRIKECVGRKM